MTCKLAMGVAKSMKRKLGEKLDLTIYSNTSKEAEPYDLKAATTVFVNHEIVPLNIATSENQMEIFLKNCIA